MEHIRAKKLIYNETWRGKIPHLVQLHLKHAKGSEADTGVTKFGLILNNGCIAFIRLSYALYVKYSFEKYTAA